MRISDWSSDVCSSDLILCKSLAPCPAQSLEARSTIAAHARQDHANAVRAGSLGNGGEQKIRRRTKALDRIVAQQADGCIRPAVNNRMLFRISDNIDRALLQLQSVRRSEEHTSELQSLMRISYAVFCL